MKVVHVNRIKAYVYVSAAGEKICIYIYIYIYIYISTRACGPQGLQGAKSMK